MGSLKFNTYMKSYTRWFALLVAMLFFGSLTFAQETATPPSKSQEVVVRIQQDAPPPPVPVADKAISDKANEWVQVGTNLGTALGSATKSILHETKDAAFGKDVSLVQGIDNFSKTDAGRFTMLVIGWKVMGKDAIDLLDRVKNVAIGVPFLICWTALFVWFYRRNFTIRAVVATKEGPFWNRKITYQTVGEAHDKRYGEGWSDAKQLGATFTTLLYAVSTVAIAINIIF